MATRGQFNSKSPTIRRILKEASELSTAPSADYTATPLDDNLFEWHFTLRGPPGGSSTPSNDKKGPYSEGIYHGRIVLPPAYPLKPPSFRFLTPSGRFETNREICLSISGHHEETWQPAWGLRTALVALRTFMETDAKGQLGGLECNDDMRRRMAAESRSWKCPHCNKSNEEIMQESSAAAQALGEGNCADTEQVPAELRMGWKDELGKRRVSVDQTASEDDKESAELAEGFVQTTTPAPAPAAASTTSTATSSTYPQARPGQSVPRPTGAVSSSPSQSALAQQQRRAPVNTSDDGVPVWIDRAIAGVILSLIVMIIKMFYSV